MEDALMRIFASDRVSGMMRKLGMKPGEAIEHPWLTKTMPTPSVKLKVVTSTFVSNCWNMMTWLTISVAPFTPSVTNCWMSAM
ncbi:hypothetical protein ACVXHA_30290 [Escherichia coli]